MKIKTFKKTLLLFMLVTLICSFSAFLTAKADVFIKADGIPIDEQTENSIKNDYLNYRLKNKLFPDIMILSDKFSVNDIMIKEHYGSFNGAYTLYIEVLEEGYPEVQYDDIVAGYKFVHPNAMGYVVWKSGNIYTLTAAYEKNIISDDDLHILAQLSKKAQVSPTSSASADTPAASTTQTSVSPSKTPSTPEPAITAPLSTPQTADNGVYFLLIISAMILVLLLSFIKVFCQGK